MVAPVTFGSIREATAHSLADLLRAAPDAPLRVRLRVALDVLWELVQTGSGALEPRRASSRMRSEHVEIAANGVARTVGEGDDSGAALLTWEILAGRAVQRDGVFVPAVGRGGLARERADAFALLERALDGSGRITRVEELFDALSRSTVGGVASYDEVRAAFQIDESTPAGGAADSFAAARRLAAAASTPAVSTDDRQAAAWRSLALQAASKGGRRLSGDVGVKASGIRRMPTSLANPPSPPPSPFNVAPTPAFAPAPIAPPPFNAPATAAFAPPRAEPFGATPAAVPAPPSSSPAFAGAQAPAAVASTRMAVVVVHAIDAERQRIAGALREAGHRVAEFTDADLALSAALAAAPLAIVADHDLRGKSGADLARRVRAQTSAIAATPMVLLVPQATTLARNTSFATGPDARLFKPVRAEDLVTELGRLLALAPRLRAARARLASLEGSADSLLRGDLRMMPLGGMLAMLEVERRTGLVRISTMRGTVGLELASGCVVRGSFQGEMVPPLDAMRALVNVHEGPFTFHALTPRMAPPDALPIHQLLRAAGRASRDELASNVDDPQTP